MSDKYDKVAARQLYDRKLIAFDEINMVAAILREAFPEPSPGQESGEDFGSWRIRLCWPTEDDAFNKFDCVIDDIGYSDRILTISCPIGESLLAARPAESAPAPREDVRALAVVLQLQSQDHRVMSGVWLNMAAAEIERYVESRIASERERASGLNNIITITRLRAEKAEAEAKALREAVLGVAKAIIDNNISLAETCQLCADAIKPIFPDWPDDARPAESAKEGEERI